MDWPLKEFLKLTYRLSVSPSSEGSALILYNTKISFETYPLHSFAIYLTFSTSSVGLR